MRGFVKVGAAIALVLLFVPIAGAFSRNPYLVMPAWMALAWVGAAWLLPADRRRGVPAGSLICGQVAWRLLQALVVGATIAHFATSVLLLAAALWVVFASSRAAAATAIALELAALGLELPKVMNLDDVVLTMGPVVAAPSILALYAAPVIVIALLGWLIAAEQRDRRVAQAFE